MNILFRVTQLFARSFNWSCPRDASTFRTKLVFFPYVFAIVPMCSLFQAITTVPAAQPERCSAPLPAAVDFHYNTPPYMSFSKFSVLLSLEREHWSKYSSSIATSCTMIFLAENTIPSKYCTSRYAYYCTGTSTYYYYLVTPCWCQVMIFLADREIAIFLADRGNVI